MFESDAWIARLLARLSGPLPGVEAHLRMVPDDRLRQIREQRQWKIPGDARRSAVLVLLYPGPEGPTIPLIVRTAYDGVHSRQIGLPGGQQEETDADFVATALREANEEIGIAPGDVEVHGLLTQLYIPPSNFLVQPVLATIAHRPDFVPDPTEVAGIIEVPLSHIVDGRYFGTNTVLHSSGTEWQVPGYKVDGHVVWGATAMILSELSALFDD